MTDVAFSELKQHIGGNKRLVTGSFVRGYDYDYVLRDEQMVLCVTRNVAEILLRRAGVEVAACFPEPEPEPEPEAKLCDHDWDHRDRVHNKGDGRGKYRVSKCRLCRKFQKKWV